MSLMSQQRETDTRVRILDGAQRSVLAVGVARTTLTDIAKAAGVSRMTIYRHYGSSEEVLQDLMTREFGSLIDAAVAAENPQAPVTRQRIVEGALAALEELIEHPLFQRILTADPELLLPYITTRPGRVQEQAADVLVGALETAGDREIRAGDTASLVQSMLLALRGYALVDKSKWTHAKRQGALADLARMLDALLAPDLSAGAAR